MMNTIEIGLNEKSINGAENRPLTDTELAHILNRAVAYDPEMIIYGSAALYLQGLSRDLNGFSADDVVTLSPFELYSRPVKRARDVDAITNLRQFAHHRKDTPLIIKDTPHGEARVLEPFPGLEIITEDPPWGTMLPSYDQLKEAAIPVFVDGVSQPVWCASPEHLIESYTWLHREKGRNGLYKGDDVRVAYVNRALTDGFRGEFIPPFITSTEALLRKQPLPGFEGNVINGSTLLRTRIPFTPELGSDVASPVTLFDRSSRLSSEKLVVATNKLLRPTLALR